MKYLFIIITFFLLFGCADKNAFTKFKMTKIQELSASSIQSTKIESNEGIDGIFSAIYLNEVYPEKYFDNEYFFISLYLKDKQEYIKHNIELNKKFPLSIKKLSFENEFSNLIGAKNSWKDYYFVVFKKENSSRLSIVFESGQSFSAPLVYQKDKQ